MTEPFPQMKQDAYTLYSDAKFEHDPSHVFALFSGGNDSKVLVQWAARTIGKCLDAAVFIDTGVALPGVREFAEDFCADRGVPLKVYETPYSEFVAMCREHGMPGAGAHRYPYVRLKERRLDDLIREHKQRWNDRIMLLSGVRRAESVQRMGTAVPVRRDGCTLWVNPLIDWTHADMRAYRDRYCLPESDVAALMHRSGECNCGAYGGGGEREMLRQLYPDWFEEKIAWLERELKAAGSPYWKWGTPRETDDGFSGDLCNCPNQLALEAA